MHSDRGRGEGIVGWERQRAPVLAAMVGSVLRTRNDVVPSFFVIGVLAKSLYRALVESPM